MKINHRWTNACLWEGEIEELGRAVAAAIAAGADLRGADLRWANLRGANLRGVDLRGVDLRGADLRWANLGGADLGRANLGGADLRGADLRGANLGGDGKLSGVLQVGPIGSRDDTLVIWFLQDGSRRYSTGCQKQITEEELLGRNGDRPTRSAYGADYIAAVEFARAWSVRNVPTTEVV